MQQPASATTTPTPRLGAGARLAAAAVVLVGGLVGPVLAFYGVGAAMDALTDGGARCGAYVGCGIGVGFLMVVVGGGGWALAGVAALVVPLVLPSRWTTARALGTAGVVVAGLVLLVTLAMVGVVVAG